MLRRTFHRHLLAVSTAAVPSWLSAQTSLGTSIPLRILVGVTPGGSTDTLARSLAPHLAKLLGRTVIVENRAGAGGNLAAEMVAKSAPDGNTLLLSFTSHAINASLYPHLPFDPLGSFTPLTCIATSPSLLVAHPSVPVKDVRELVALAKAKPGKLNFALGGVGSSLHMAGDAFKQQAGVFIVNIPYKGTTPAVADVLAGQVELMFAAVGNVQQHIKAGKLKLLGVTSPKRLAAYPDAPAIAEVLPGYESSAWFGLFAPAKMPPDLGKALSDAARAAVGAPEMQQRLAFDGMMPVASSPADFQKFVQSEITRWGKVVKYSGAKPE